MSKDYSVDLNSLSLPILKIDGVYFHSSHNPYNEKRLLEHWRDGKDLFPSTLILIGVGLGYVLEFFKEHPEKEVHTNIFCLFAERKELELFEKYRNILHWTGKLKSILWEDRQSWEYILYATSAKQIGIFTHPQFKRMNIEKAQEIEKELQLTLKRSLMNQITDTAFGFRWWRNALRNLSFISYSALSKRVPKTKIPFLLLGSGYSTYTHISEIVVKQEQYLIMAVPPVLDLLRHWNISPDIVIMTDPASANRFYHSIASLPKTTLLIAYNYVYPLLLEWFKGSIFLMNGSLEQESCLSPFLPTILSGGSVANTMIEIAGLWSSDITLSGFDFSYKANHPHYPGSPLETNALFHSTRFGSGEKRFAQILRGENAVMWEEKITSPVLKAYGEYFQTQITKMKEKDIRVSHWQDVEDDNKIRKGLLKEKREFLTTHFTLNPSQQISKKILQTQLQDLNEQITTVLKTKEYENFPCFKSLLAKLLIKGEDTTPFLKKEQDFLGRLIQFLEKPVSEI